MIINNLELTVEIYTVLLFLLAVNILASRISCFGPSLLNILSLNSSNYSEPILDKDKLLFPRKTHAHAATSKNVCLPIVCCAVIIQCKHCWCSMGFIRLKRIRWAWNAMFSPPPHKGPSATTKTQPTHPGIQAIDFCFLILIRVVDNTKAAQLMLKHFTSSFYW